MWNKEAEARFDATPLNDNWMFTHIFADERVFRPFIEGLLEHPVGKITAIGYEHQASDIYGSRGIRMDVYAREEDKVIYNVEMQNATEGFSFKRIRYQQARIDQAMLKPGSKVKDLPGTIIIFVCDFPMFDGSWACYERQTFWTPGPNEGEDGSRVYLLCSSYENSNVSPEIEDMLQSLSESPRDFAGFGDLAESVQRRFHELRSLDSERSDFMSYQSEAYKRGKEELLLSMARVIPAELLAKGANISLEEAKEYVRRANAGVPSEMNVQGI